MFCKEYDDFLDCHVLPIFEDTVLFCSVHCTVMVPVALKYSVSEAIGWLRSCPDLLYFTVV